MKTHIETQRNYTTLVVLYTRVTLVVSELSLNNPKLQCITGRIILPYKTQLIHLHKNHTGRTKIQVTMKTLLTSMLFSEYPRPFHSGSICFF